MAKEEKDKDKDKEAESSGKSSPSTMKIVIIAVVLSLVLGGALVGGTFYFVSGMNATQAVATTDKNADAEEADDVDEDEPLAPPKYFSLDPKFVVSFSDQSSARFMQFSIQVMARDDAVIKLMEEHMPVVRSSLLMLFGGQQYEVMVTREGKEKLLREATEDINTSLKKAMGNKEQTALIEATYYDSFVIQ